MLRYFSGPRPFVNKLFDCDLLDVRLAMIGEERTHFEIPYSLLMKITANNIHAKIAPVILDEMLWLWKFQRTYQVKEDLAFFKPKVRIFSLIDFDHRYPAAAQLRKEIISEWFQLTMWYTRLI